MGREVSRCRSSVTRCLLRDQDRLRDYGDYDRTDVMVLGHTLILLSTGTSIHVACNEFFVRCVFPREYVAALSSKSIGRSKCQTFLLST
jgi:hypothetical protein